MSTTPRIHHRRASIKIEGDVANNTVLTNLESRVSVFLRDVTHGTVQLAHSERDTFSAHFVCTPASLRGNNEAAIRAAMPRLLDRVGWSAYVDQRLLPVDHAGSGVLMPTPTLVLKYQSRAVGGWSFPAVVAAAVALVGCLGLLTYHLYWLFFEARA